MFEGRVNFGRFCRGSLTVAVAGRVLYLSRPSRTDSTISSVEMFRSIPATSRAERLAFSGFRVNTCPLDRLIRTSPSLDARSSKTDKFPCVSEYVCIPKSKLQLSKKFGGRRDLDSAIFFQN